MPDIVITPNRGTSNNPKIDFTGTSAGTIKLEVLADGTIAWNGANGSLFSIADSLSGSLMSVNDISGLPAFEVFSDNRVIVGQFGARLGIGTVNPSSSAKLHIAGLNTAPPNVFLQTTNSSANGGIFWRNSSNATTSAIASNYNVSDASGNIEFLSGGANTRMVVASGGNVGVGTTAPSALFQVASAASGNFRLDSNGSGGHYYQAESNARLGFGRDLVTSAGHISFTMGGGSVATLGSAITMPANSQLGFYTSNGTSLVERMRLDGSGNVGVGITSNIRGILHVNGSNYSEAPTVNKLITVSDSASSDKYMILSYHSSPDCGVIQGLHHGTAWKSVSINPNGANVGIGTTSPGYKLDVTGDVRVTGTLIVQDGTASTNIFGLTTFTKSLTVTTSWSDVGISGADLTTGTYIIQVTVDNYDVSGGQYSERYSGVMSWISTTTNSTDVDEIVLHKAGHAPNGNWINLRTVRQAPNLTMKLQIIANGNTSGADNYIFKFRRMI